LQLIKPSFNPFVVLTRFPWFVITVLFSTFKRLGSIL